MHSVVWCVVFVYSFVDLSIGWLLLKSDRMRFYVNVVIRLWAPLQKHTHTHKFKLCEWQTDQNIKRMDLIRNGHHNIHCMIVSNGHLNWFYSIHSSVADLFNRKLLSLLLKCGCTFVYSLIFLLLDSDWNIDTTVINSTI